MFFRERSDEEYLVGTRDLNVGELVKFSYAGRIYSRRISHKEITRIKNSGTNIIDIGVYTLSRIYGPVADFKFTDINITYDIGGF